MKSKALLVILVGMSSLLALTGCGPNLGWLNPGWMTRVIGSGQVATETRSVSEFDGLVVNGAGKVFIDQTGTESLSISTDDNLLPYISTEVRGSKLVIDFEQNVIPRNVTDLTFRVTAKDLNSLEVNGAAILQASGIETDHISVNVSGAGAIRMAGKVDELDVALQGAGAFNSENLEAKRARVTNNGAGAALVRVSDTLDATINGVGVIRYIGNPQVTQGVHGIGVVSRR